MYEANGIATNEKKAAKNSNQKPEISILSIEEAVSKLKI